MNTTLFDEGRGDFTTALKKLYSAPRSLGVDPSGRLVEDLSKRQPPDEVRSFSGTPSAVAMYSEDERAVETRGLIKALHKGGGAPLTKLEAAR